MNTYTQIESQILSFIDNEKNGNFEELIIQAHLFQKENCQLLRNYCESICKEPRSWQDIPPLPTEAFKNSDEQIISFPKKQISSTFLTSGTTGEVRGSHHFHNLKLYEKSIHSTWTNLQLPKLPIICLTQSPPASPDSSLIHMLSTLGGKFLINSSGHLNHSNLKLIIKKNNRPLVLAGTALAFLHLFESGKDIPTLPENSWVMETGGYKGSGREINKEDFYMMINNNLNVPIENIINEYSMTELSSQFYSIGMHDIHKGCHWVRTRVLKPGSDEEVPDEEIGLLSIYDLANLGSSISIMTNDLAKRKGDTFELLGRDKKSTPRGCSRATDEMLSKIKYGHK
ncbi:MAG: hypothetical protein VYC70_00335 [Verrucomicrobiota bacterium]|nr:hypothetical protein [Verrucomicrobiota bacterium]